MNNFANNQSQSNTLMQNNPFLHNLPRADNTTNNNCQNRHNNINQVEPQRGNFFMPPDQNDDLTLGTRNFNEFIDIQSLS